MKEIMHLNIRHLKDLASINANSLYAKLDTVSFSLFDSNLHGEKKNTAQDSEIVDSKIKECSQIILCFH